ncbi:hypothetical protein ABIA52_003980 [Paenarthrobacter histidinolovorans]|uniref:Uncharacterized protein n=1 Tax=Paenarthrobacter histidinolovorans TaxID=43664 RepID=A0ABW8NBX2_9MICC
MISSVTISIPAGMAAFVVWLSVTDGNLPDAAALIRWDNAYVGTHSGSLLVSVLGYLLASVAAAKLANHIFSRKTVTPLVHKHTLWTELFRVKKLDEREAVAMVVMKSGDIWQGIVGNFSADHETDDRELVLYKPILHRSEVREKPVHQPHDVLVLRGSEISSIGINYTPKAEGTPSRPDSSRNPKKCR